VCWTSFNYRQVLRGVGVELGLGEGALTPHVARITAATIASRAGLSMEELKRIGNWVSSESTSHYVRLTGKDTMKVQSKIRNHLEIGRA